MTEPTTSTRRTIGLVVGAALIALGLMLGTGLFVEASTRAAVAAEQGQAAEAAIDTNREITEARHKTFRYLEEKAGGPLYEACYANSTLWACDILDIRPGLHTRVMVQRSGAGSPELDQMQADQILSALNGPGSPLEHVSVVSIEHPAVQAHAA